MLDPRVLWHGYSHLPEAGPREGIDEVRRWADAFREAWGEIQVRVETLIDVDDQSVLALVRMMGRGRGSAPPWSPDSMATSGPCARVVWWQSTCTKAQGAPSKPWDCGSRRCRLKQSGRERCFAWKAKAEPTTGRLSLLAQRDSGAQRKSSAMRKAAAAARH
jgi:hypothetical protein